MINIYIFNSEIKIKYVAVQINEAQIHKKNSIQSCKYTNYY